MQMTLDTEFYKLPLRFEAERLAAEVLAFSESEWREHPQKHAGNSAIPLISVGGGMNDEVRGAMRPTEFLRRSPYLQQVLASFRTPLGRARLMRIAGQGDATLHVDTNYYWMHHVRIHVPAVTWPPVRFVCGEREVHMAPGEAWIFDSWKLHNVINPVTEPRIHLVADTVGSSYFWSELVAGAERPFDGASGTGTTPRMVPFSPGPGEGLEPWLERTNFPAVMTPWEQECLLQKVRAEMAAREDRGGEAWRQMEAQLRSFQQDWHGAWARYGEEAAGRPEYQRLLGGLEAALAPWAGKVRLSNQAEVVEILRQIVVRPALGPVAASSPVVASLPCLESPLPPDRAPVLERPVFIIAAPRSGSSLLFETLSRAREFCTIGGESHELIECLPGLHPAERGYDSNRLTAEAATPEIAARLRENFLARLVDRDGRPPVGGPIRLLEKTPKNALRIPFLRAAFPNARFIYLQREPRGNVASIMEAWRSGKFITYPKLPGWSGPPWSLLLTPDWSALAGKTPAEVAAAQWGQTHAQVMDDLSALPAGSWTTIDYDELLAQPEACIERLCAFAEVTWDRPPAGPLPLARHTLTPPAPEKWRAHEAALAPLQASLAEQWSRIQEFAAKPSSPGQPAGSDPQPPASGNGLRSVVTSSFAPLLAELGISLAVTTYQAGKLVLLRAEGDRLNTHFHNFPSPMGLAYDGLRLAVGTLHEVHLLLNQRAVAAKLPGGKHDACFVRRTSHVTGDIRVHDIAWGEEDLWIVNTRFSCLCTLETDYSFVPRWRPRFVSALAPEDRCHLNGLAMADGAPKWVTCLGQTDTAGGWRVNKASGGCIIDIGSDAVVAEGLSMPHSPRWYGGRLWVLESGKGEIGTVDLQTGAVTVLARLPGFTRGLDFHGPLAFVGLSQVRETSVFAGLPLTEQLTERTCGVWVLDIRDGRTVAFLRFEEELQEIFAVQVLAGVRYPEVVTEEKEWLSSSFVLPEAGDETLT